MNRIKVLALVGICFSALIAPLTTTLIAAETKRLSITVLDPIRSTDTEDKPVVYHLIGGQTVELPLVIRGQFEKPLSLRARLVQTAWSLAALTTVNLNILTDQSLTTGNSRETTVSVPLPEVRDETNFELVFQAKTKDTEWFDVSSTKLRLYSNTILEPLKLLSQKIILRLKDDRDMLRPTLENLEVFVVDHRAPIPRYDQPILTLIINSNHKQDFLTWDTVDRQRHDLESIILFNEQVRTVPKVDKMPYQDGHLVQVELELLKHLHNDPRSQKAFMEIINLAYPSEKGTDE